MQTNSAVRISVPARESFQYFAIGDYPKRVEDDRFLRGKGRYLDDRPVRGNRARRCSQKPSRSSAHRRDRCGWSFSRPAGTPPGRCGCVYDWGCVWRASRSVHYAAGGGVYDFPAVHLDIAAVLTNTVRDKRSGSAPSTTPRPGSCWPARSWTMACRARVTFHRSISA